MITIISENTTFRKKSFLEKAVKISFEHVNISETAFDVSILITNDESIQALNKTYRGIDRPTDVLSFSADVITPDYGSRYLGDIVISYDTALDQSILAGHSVENELSLLAIHGVLHLLGYDHSTISEKQLMWKQQFSILNRLGIIMDKYSGDD